MKAKRPRAKKPQSPGKAPNAVKPTDRGWAAVGDFIRMQRQLANLSLRQLADMAKVSNPYLSQIERGMYKPSADVLKSLAKALEVSAETLFVRAGLLDEMSDSCTVEQAIRLDRALSAKQKEALIGVYRGFLR